MILRINSHHSHNNIDRLVFVLTLIFFEVRKRMLGEMIHLKYPIGLLISHFNEASTLHSESKKKLK
jgi:hypothetical protein